jgi:hypothetical protein
MPPLGFSTAIRKARELGRRSLALAGARPRMVVPGARYAPRPHDAVLVIQRGPNPSTDYYLRPRLERETAPWVVADLDGRPQDAPLLRDAQSLLVVICRYVSGPWLDALQAARPRIARVALFLDDDLPAMIADPTLPGSVRGKVAEHFGRHVERLDGLVSEVWLSTPALAERYPDRALVLEPVPESEPAAPSPPGELRVVYHGTDTHPEEREFVVEVARELARRGSPTRVEVTGDARLRAAAAGLPNLEVVPQLAWPDYLAAQAGRSAALLLAPLSDTAVNAARAPVKAFDAARLGAAGLYADAPPYRGFVRPGADGLLLPMQPAAWADAVEALLVDAERRRALAAAAAERFAALRAGRGALPAPPA